MVDVTSTTHSSEAHVEKTGAAKQRCQSTATANTFAMVRLYTKRREVAGARERERDRERERERDREREINSSISTHLGSPVNTDDNPYCMCSTYVR
jgi:hypothetical protein